MSNLVARLDTKIHTSPRCWTWLACKNAHGYGLVSVSNKSRLAHRVVFELFNGKIPDGLVLDHLCRNPACVNPDHLEAVTHTENVRRGHGGRHWAAKTHCPQGHPYSGANLKLYKNGGRTCRECTNARRRKTP